MFKMTLFRFWNALEYSGAQGIESLIRSDLCFIDEKGCFVSVTLRPSMMEKIAASLFRTVPVFGLIHHNTIEGFDSRRESGSLCKPLKDSYRECCCNLLRAKLILIRETPGPRRVELFMSRKSHLKRDFEVALGHPHSWVYDRPAPSHRLSHPRPFFGLGVRQVEGKTPWSHSMTSKKGRNHD